MIRLGIVEDNRTYLEALEAYLSRAPDFELAPAVPNLKSLPGLIAVRPDVVIMDIDLGEDSGISGVRMIREALPLTGILMLTVFDDQEKIVDAIQAGASGYLLKKDSPKKIMEAVRNIYKGEGFMNGQVARTLIEAFREPPRHEPDFAGYNLTRREDEIVRLLMDGLPYKDIATQLYISMATLNTHVKNIYDKLGIHSRAEIAARFRR